MKTKTIALLEIAIVLCSVLLVALPAIAADMQEVSASTITSASEDDYVLDIYGNANEDDTIDMRDLTYVKLIFFGKKPETELADAKYDGKIDPLDFIQIKLIIVGKEKELTIVDDADRIVTVKKPVERIVLASGRPDAVRILHETAKVVGVDKTIIRQKTFYPELSKLPLIGGFHNPDPEAILNLRPDLVFAEKEAIPPEQLEDMLPGVTVVRIGCSDPCTVTYGIKKLGYVLDKEDEAEKYISWYNGHLDKILERTEGLLDEEKPRVYMEWFYSPDKTISRGTGGHDMCIIAGGINVAADLTGANPKVDPEWVIMQNPDIVIKAMAHGSGFATYETDDPSEVKAFRDEMMRRPGWENIAAVKNGDVYCISPWIWTSPSHFVCIAYMAKLFYPELFEDMDPEKIHEEFLTRFQGLDYDLDEHGIFVYPAIEIGGNLAGIPDRYKGEI